MLRSLGTAAVLAVVGTVAAIVWAFVIGLVGVPGVRLAGAGRRRGRTALVGAGSVLTLLSQGYLALAFTGFVALGLGEWLGSRPHLVAWPFWLVGTYLAAAPPLYAPRDDSRDIQGRERGAELLVLVLLAGLAFWAFVRWPAVFGAGWPWVPTLEL